MNLLSRLSFFVLLLTLGCTGAPSGPSQAQIDSENSIANTIEEYNDNLNNYQGFTEEYNFAKSRGVDISRVQSTDNQISGIFIESNSSIGLAQQYYSTGQYSNANNVAQTASTSLSNIGPLIDQANKLLQESYDSTVNNYKTKIQNSELEIQVASAYIKDAENVDATVEDLSKYLIDTSNLLEIAKAHFSNMEFNLIGYYLDKISTDTVRIKEDALYQKRDHLTSVAIDEANKMIKTDEGRLLVENAITEKNTGNFQEAIHLLNKAIVSEFFKEYKENRGILIDYYQEKHIELDLGPIDSLENEIDMKMASKKYSDALVILPDYKDMVENAMIASRKCSNAERALNSVAGISYLGLQTETSIIRSNYLNAIDNLKEGDYDSAIAKADLSIEEAEKEKIRYYSQFENNLLLKILSNFFSLFGKTHPIITYESVEGISLSWLQIPETLISVDLSPPTVDLDTGQLTSISSPVVALNISTTQSSDPVDFKLIVREPSYSTRFSVSVIGSASIKNIGDKTAHGVRVRYELFSWDGSRIKLSGQDYIEKYVGDIKGGQTKTENVEFTIGLGDGANIQSNGGKSIYRIYSSEKNKVIEETFTV